MAMAMAAMTPAPRPPPPSWAELLWPSPACPVSLGVWALVEAVDVSGGLVDSTEDPVEPVAGPSVAVVLAVVVLLESAAVDVPAVLSFVDNGSLRVELAELLGATCSSKGVDSVAVVSTLGISNAKANHGSRFSVSTA